MNIIVTRMSNDTKNKKQIKKKKKKETINIFQ